MALLSLAERGIEQAAREAGWQPYRLYGMQGYHYPPQQGVKPCRFKVFDAKAKSKYRWIGGKPQGCEYYLPHGESRLKQAISVAGGVLWIANGEASQLAYYAAGIYNVVSWFGEGKTLTHKFANDLKAWGVRVVRYPVDNDDAGRKSAQNVRKALKDSGITFQQLQWGDTVPDKGDANDAWIASGFDTARFVELLTNLEAFLLPTEEEAPRRSVYMRQFSSNSLSRTGAIAAVQDKIEQHGKVKRRGEWIDFHCLLHADSRPSASYSPVSGVYICRSGCGTFKLHEICEKLGIDYTPTALPAPARLRTKPAPAADAAPVPTPTIAADMTVNTRYIELPTDVPQTCIAVKSDVGTGKTKAAIEAAHKADRVLYLTHREKLAQNFVEDANRAGVTFEHYKAISRVDHHRVNKLATCINTYCDGHGKLIVPNMLIIDEIEQLLDHIYGDAGTFKGNQAIIAGEALEYVIRHAERVLVFDAHLSDVAIDYLKQLRPEGDVLVIENLLVTERGTLTLHEKRETAISKGQALIRENASTVVFACASEQDARIIAADLSTEFGKDNVLLIRAENAGAKRQRAFTKNPNAEIGKYRAVVYSPVIGTGFDITAPVRAVIGIMGTHLSAYDARQMIGRCRAARELHVWLPNTKPTRAESAEAIEERELAKAHRSYLKLTADGYIVSDVTANQRRYVYWHGRVVGRRNQSLNCLRQHFVELAAGYAVQTEQGRDSAQRKRVQEIEKALDDTLKALVLTAEPLGADDYERLVDEGRLDDRSKAGYLRWLIEQTAGTSITPELRDALWTERQRSNLIHFTDIVDDIAELKLADADEALVDVPLHKRKYRTMRRNVSVRFINPLVDKTGQVVSFSADELHSIYEQLIERHKDDLQNYFGWQPERCKTIPAIVRHVLSYMGLKLKGDRRRVNGKRVQVYQLDQAELDAMKVLAAGRLVALRRRREEERVGGCPKIANKRYIPSNAILGQPDTIHAVAAYSSAAPAAVAV